jgi:hypothetical protein
VRSSLSAVGVAAHPPRGFQSVDYLAGRADRDRDLTGQVNDPAVVAAADDPQGPELAGSQAVLGPQPLTESVVEPRLRVDEVEEHLDEVGHKPLGQSRSRRYSTRPTAARA